MASSVTKDAEKSLAMQSPRDKMQTHPGLTFSLKNHPNAGNQLQALTIPVSNHTRLMSAHTFVTVSQSLVVLTQILMVFGLLYWSSQLQYNLQYYNDYASPYIEEAMHHGLSIIRHTDNATHALETMSQRADIMSADSRPEIEEALHHGLSIMRHTDNTTHAIETISSNSVPDLMNAVNHTVDVISNLRKFAATPRIQMSLV